MGAAGRRHLRHGCSTIASLAGDAIFERGYLGKPYRYVPLFAPGGAAGVPEGASVYEVNRRRIDLRPADALPEARDRLAITSGWPTGSTPPPSAWTSGCIRRLGAGGEHDRLRLMIDLGSIF